MKFVFCPSSNLVMARIKLKRGQTLFDAGHIIKLGWRQLQLQLLNSNCFVN